MQPSEVLHWYLSVVRRSSGARAVSLYLPALVDGGPSPLLLHDGEGAPPPELVDLGATGELEEVSGPWHDDDGRPLARVLPSRDACCRLLQLPPPEVLSRLSEPGPDTPTPARRRADQVRQRVPPVWMGLRYSTEPALPLTGENGSALPANGESGLDLFAFAAALSSHLREVHEILSDPVTGLPGRYEFQGRLAAALATARQQETPLSLLLVNPDAFTTVNERFGRQVGDRVIRTISSRLRSALRSSDLVAKYGGAIFACILEGADHAGASFVAEKILEVLSTTPYVDEALGLGFSVGAATYLPERDELDSALELLRRADQALTRAKRSGGGRLATWTPSLDSEASLPAVELSGVFTGNLAKDYRNMALLTETMAAVAGSASAGELSVRVLEALATTLQADRVALFELSEDQPPQLVKGFSRANGESGTSADFIFPEDVRSLAGEARTTDGVIQRCDGMDSSGKRRTVFVAPLVVGGTCVGSLYLDGREGALRLDASDGPFLRSLGAQIGAALDRARLDQLERERRQRESDRLQAEIEELRHALRQSKLEYRSREMEMLLATLRRVARTDATVLISGESGTGKELLARTLHRLSPRRGGPLVVVDCAAIPTSRIERELFGQLDGGVNGAEPGHRGRLADGDGGTVLLDEVSDLPPEVQNRLLRFVQDRLVTPVGAHSPQPVNVRIVAATNRDLTAEVAAGRFREDLYYRLNVVRLQVPALRDRPDDILHLAEHFLSTFGLLYRKPVKRLSTDAEAALLRHSWPGNVRELENQMQQAVILSDGEELGAGELCLVERATTSKIAGGGAVASKDETSPSELWTLLRSFLGRHVEITSRRGRPAAPLGKWLGDDLVLEADVAAGGIASRAAATLGIPETTFRRRRSKASAEVEAGLAPRPTSWQDVQKILSGLVRAPRTNGEDLMEMTQNLLLEAVLSEIPGDVKTGARLLGVTPPTFRRRAAGYRARTS